MIVNEKLTNEAYEESISNISPNRGFVEKETLIMRKQVNMLLSLDATLLVVLENTLSTKIIISLKKYG